MELESLDHCILCHGKNIGPLCEQNRYSSCTSCGHVFDNPRPPWKAIVGFYSQNDKYDDWLAEEAARDDLWQRRVKLVLKYRQSGTLLDVGAGIGQFLKYAKAHFDVSGSEISPVAIKIAQEKYGITLNQGTIDDISWGKTFDVVTLFHVLEHVPDPDDTLKRCHSLLSPGGVLILAVPNDVESILTRRNRLMRKLGFAKYQELGELGLPPLSLTGSEIHLSHFKESVLRSALETRGFDVIDSGLDPAFSASGFRKMRRLRRFHTYRAIQSVSGLNLYDTIWMVGKR